MEKICWQITVAAFMQPLQDDLRDPAAKDNSITNAATARSNLDAAITMRSAETELQNTIELRATASEIVAPKPDRISTPERKQDDFEALFKRIFRRKITSAKMEKICWQITVAAFMQPLQYDLRSPAAKDNSITHAATAWSNLHAAITMRSAETELQNTRELRAMASEIVAPKPDLDARAEKNDFEALLKRIFRRKITSAKMEKKTHFVRDFLQNSIGNSSTSTTCNPIYIAGTIHSCKSQWNSVDRTCTKNTWNPIYNAEPIREWSDHDPTTHETVSHPSHRRGRSSAFGDGLCMEKHRVSCICYLSKAHFVRDFLQNSIGNSSTSTTCNPICIAATILQLQITMEFCRPHVHEKHLKPHLQCGTDPRMIRPWSDHTRDRLAPVAPQR